MHAFAILEDGFEGDEQRIKIARLHTTRYELSEDPHSSGVEPRIIDLRRIIAPDSMSLQKVFIGPIPLFMWRTPWTVFHNQTETWIPVLDTTDNTCVPGSFVYTPIRDTEEQRTARKVEQFALRRRAFSMANMGYPPPTVVVVQPPLVVTHSFQIAAAAVPVIRAAPITIPTFVANMIKANAIEKKEICPISLDPFTAETNTTITSCFHLFQTESIVRWLETNTACPVCKTDIHSHQVVI